ncbi:hypothetical protein LEP1GSC090_0068 [Leptospira borgpetersenii serovar Javanica str. MK146]|nr:hypothetical protein LEP1GSC090_0068 [Leptospira borgpetersenii serovar Javanica str. MK146]
MFVVDRGLLDWIRYTTGNLGKTEQYCPAGYRSVYKRVKRTLPPDFQLSDDWIRRLYEIAVSTIDTAQGERNMRCLSAS